MDNKKSTQSTAWKEVYANLKRKLPDHAMNAWFDPVVPVSFDNNKFVLSVPSQFFLEWIESHYNEHLKTTLRLLFGNEAVHSFVIHKSEQSNAIEQIRNHAVPQNNKSKLNNLNPKYVFDKFIVGDNNEFAKTASESVAKNPGDNNFNLICGLQRGASWPLFIRRHRTAAPAYGRVRPPGAHSFTFVG